MSTSLLALQGKYWVLIESDWDGAPCLLSHVDKGQEAVEVGVSCVHSQPAAETVVELLTPSHCHVDGHAIKVWSGASPPPNSPPRFNNQFKPKNISHSSRSAPLCVRSASPSGERARRRSPSTAQSTAASSKTRLVPRRSQKCALGPCWALRSSTAIHGGVPVWDGHALWRFVSLCSQWSPDP